MASSASAVCTATGCQTYPDIVLDGGGYIAIVWEEGRTGYYDVGAQRLNSSGTGKSSVGRADRRDPGDPFRTAVSVVRGLDRSHTDSEKYLLTGPGHGSIIQCILKGLKL